MRREADEPVGSKRGTQLRGPPAPSASNRRQAARTAAASDQRRGRVLGVVVPVVLVSPVP
jgi:hypothetical protein